MFEEKFPLRLARLRMQKGVSAREMSLSLGQSPGYINSIENGKALPSMSVFFYICEYLDITPREFFDFDATSHPREMDAIYEKLARLPEKERSALGVIVDALSAHT